MSKQSSLARIEEIADKVAAAAGIEIVEIELKGGGKNQFLRISIDKPEGVTHEDCQNVSHQVSEILDSGDLIPSHYTLEVSSPGVERKLLKLKDFARFEGQKVKVVLREPVENKKSLEGMLAGVADDQIALDLAGGQRVHFAHRQVERANLKFEW